MKGRAAGNKEVRIRKKQGKPEADPPEVEVSRKGKVTWVLDADAEDWAVLLDGKTPFVGSKGFFSGKGKGSSGGAKIDEHAVEKGEKFKYWIVWRDANGDVSYVDPRIIIFD